MNNQTDDRIDTITTPTVYGLFHEGLMIYVGGTTQSLKRRKGGHINYAINQGGTAAIYRYIREKVDEPEGDLSIHELDIDTEQEALDKYGDDTLNDDRKASANSYDGYDWAPEEVDVLEAHSIHRASQILDASFNACRRAAHKLGLLESRDHTPVDWEEWDHLLGTMPDTELADRIGCTAENVQRRRTKLEIEPYGDSGLALEKAAAAEVYIGYHVNDRTYDELAEEYDVAPGTIGRIIRGETYDDLSREHLDSVIERVNALLGEETGDGVEGLLDKAIA